MLSPFQIFGPSAVSETRTSFLSTALFNVSLFVSCFCEMNLIRHSNNEESQTVDRVKKIYSYILPKLEQDSFEKI